MPVRIMRTVVDGAEQVAAGSVRRVAPIVPARFRPVARRLRGWAWRLADELHAAARRFGSGRDAGASIAGASRHDGGRRHVLVVDHSSPDPSRDAGSAYMLAIMRLLRADGYHVTFLPADGRMTDAAAETLHALEVGTGNGMGILDWLLANGRMLSHAIVARPDVALRQLPRIRRWSGARVLYYTHDLHALRERRRYEVTGDAAALVASRRFDDVETAALRAADLVITPSDAEVEQVRAMAPTADVRVVVPFVGRPTEHLPTDPAPPPDEAPSPRRAILFVGSFTHAPNVDAAIMLVEGLMPRVWQRVPDARVRIVGQQPPAGVLALAGPRVEVSGHVPDLAPCWAEARLSVAPLRFGAGVKGKILASLAEGVPVVTTSVGNEGIGLVHREHAYIADVPADIADGIIAVLEDDQLAGTLSRNGRRFVDERFSIDVARRGLRRALEDARLDHAPPEGAMTR